jgi:hypothetical protein
VLLPTLLSDALTIGGLVGGIGGSGSTAGFAVAITGLVGHGISGPIVHLAHGHPLKALASLGLEAALPGAFIGLMFATSHSCEDICAGPVLFGLVGVPLAMTVGPAVDSAALSWEDPPSAKDAAAKPSLHVAPLMLPSLKVGAGRASSPGGVSLVGTF